MIGGLYLAWLLPVWLLSVSSEPKSKHSLTIASDVMMFCPSTRGQAAMDLTLRESQNKLSLSLSSSHCHFFFLQTRKVTHTGHTVSGDAAHLE